MTNPLSAHIRAAVVNRRCKYSSMRDVLISTLSKILTEKKLALMAKKQQSPEAIRSSILKNKQHLESKKNSLLAKLKTDYAEVIAKMRSGMKAMPQKENMITASKFINSSKYNNKQGVVINSTDANDTQITASSLPTVEDKRLSNVKLREALKPLSSNKLNDKLGAVVKRLPADYNEDKLQQLVKNNITKLLELSVTPILREQEWFVDSKDYHLGKGDLYFQHPSKPVFYVIETKG